MGLLREAEDLEHTPLEPIQAKEQEERREVVGARMGRSQTSKARCFGPGRDGGH